MNIPSLASPAGESALRTTPPSTLIVEHLSQCFLGLKSMLLFELWGSLSWIGVAARAEEADRADTVGVGGEDKLRCSK